MAKQMDLFSKKTKKKKAAPKKRKPAAKKGSSAPAKKKKVQSISVKAYKVKAHTRKPAKRR